MSEYEVVCGDTSCAIAVEARPTVSGGPVWIATPHVIAGDTIAPVKGTTTSLAEIAAGSEAQAVEDACVFLELRLGERRSPPRVAKSRAAVMLRAVSPRTLTVRTDTTVAG
jgi:hypothetical protein